MKRKLIEALNQRRQMILSRFTIEDLDNPKTKKSITTALMLIDKELQK